MTCSQSRRHDAVKDLIHDPSRRDEGIAATYQICIDNCVCLRHQSVSDPSPETKQTTMTSSQLVSALSSRMGRQRSSIGRLLSGSWECLEGSCGSTALSNHYHTSGPKNDQEQSQASSFRERLARGPGLDEFIQGTYSVYAPPPKVRRYLRGSRLVGGLGVGLPAVQFPSLSISAFVTHGHECP